MLFVVILIPGISGIIGMNTERKHLMYGSVIYMKKTGKKINDPFRKYTLAEIEEFVKTLPLLSDMLYLKQQRREAREIAWMQGIHWDGVVRNQHQSSQDR